MTTTDERLTKHDRPDDEIRPVPEESDSTELGRDEADGLVNDDDAPLPEELPEDGDAPIVREEADEDAAARPDRRALSGPMRTARRVAVAPLRSADGAWTATTDLFRGTLEARGFPGAARIDEDMERLRPLGRALLTDHSLEGGATEFDTGDLLIEVVYVYGTTTPGEDLALPPVEALGSLPIDLVPTLTFHVVRPVQDAYLEEIMTKTEDAGRIAVRVVGLDRES